MKGCSIFWSCHRFQRYWDHKALRPLDWGRKGLRPHWIETTQDWDHTGLRPYRTETIQDWDHTGLKPLDWDYWIETTGLRPQDWDNWIETTLDWDHWIETTLDWDQTGLRNTYERPNRLRDLVKDFCIKETRLRKLILATGLVWKSIQATQRPLMHENLTKISF